MPHASLLHRTLLALAIASAAAVAVGCLLFMTAEYDEAWIIASHRQVFAPGAIPPASPVLTTGGLHLLATGLVSALGLAPLPAMRMVSLLSVLALLALVWRVAGRWCEDAVERMIVAVACLAAPGTMLMAGMGYGVALATLLFAAGLALLLDAPRPALGRALMAGLLVGAACATRWTFLPALPALLLPALLAAEHRRGALVGAAAALATAALAFGASVWLHALLSAAGDASLVADNASAAGVGGLEKSFTRQVSFLARLSATFPLALLALAAFAYATSRGDDRARRGIATLLAAAALIVGAWVASAPWMHLRYVWPAYLMVAACAGLGLVRLHRLGRERELPALRTLAVVLPLALFAGQVMLTGRLVALGAGMQVNAAGVENLENYFTPFLLHEEETRMTDYLAASPPGTVFGAVFLPYEQGALGLGLMSGRLVRDFAMDPAPEPRPDFVIHHALAPLDEDGLAWLDALGEPVRRIGLYTVWALPDGVAMPEVAEVTIDKQLYRFALTRHVTLSGSR